MYKHLKKVMIASVATLALSLPINASTFDAETLDTFIEDASACVAGKVIGITYEDRGGIVMTRATFQVTDTAFGSTAGTISVLTPGGPIPDAKFPVAQVFAGAPTLRQGQEFMLVLNQVSSGDYSISGLSVGAIPIVNSAEGPQVALGGNQGFIALADALDTVQDLRDADAADAVPN